MKKFRVVIVDSDIPHKKYEDEILGKINAEVVKFDCKSEDEVISVAKNGDAILVNVAPITKRVISHLENCKIIVVYGIGYDNVDLFAASERGIYVCNVPDFMTFEVADHTLSLILSLVRKIPWIGQMTKSGHWYDSLVQFESIYRLDGLTAGIIGFGRIGRQVAERLSAFHVKLLVYDPYVSSDIVQQFGASKVELKTLLKNSDIVTIHVPLTKETWHLIGLSELRLMKRSAILINTSRGAVIDQKYLVEALKNKWISAAGLDVLEEEPPKRDDPILGLDNVIITPHMAFYSVDSVADLHKKAAKEVVRVLQGKKPMHLVNRDVLLKKNNMCYLCINIGNSC
jgi:D-3-phosphoglycerate dehydrogenase